ncbi:substrate binding domain-containing protein [Shimwellia blattae]|uniref:substrate binding domain-containing protein n=1 Tax=Shimwellia blattae TaxID=563 RepID=UPI002F955C28
MSPPGHHPATRRETVLPGADRGCINLNPEQGVRFPLISEFCRENPGVSVRLLFSDEVSNIYRDPIDIAVRYGELKNSSYVALPLAPHNRRVLVASPEYLAREGALKSPADLAGRECILWFRNEHIHNAWSFSGAAGQQTIIVHGRYVSNDADVSRRWALAGYGIAYKSWLDVQEEIASGRLVPLLADLRGEKAPLNFICPHRSQFSPVVRQIYTILRDFFATIPPQAE